MKHRPFAAKDPYFDREARKYARPIASREHILDFLDRYGAPLTYGEVVSGLGLSEEDDLEALRRRLAAMVRDGQLLLNRRSRYCVVNRKDLISGRVIGHPDGFGFLRPDEGSEDLYLSAQQMRALMHGDRAVVCVKGIDRRGRREAVVVEVLERNSSCLVGRLHREGGVSYLIPDDKRISQDILIAEDDSAGAGHGQIVVVEITEQPTHRKQPVGRVVEILGDHMAPGMEIEVAIRSRGLPYIWPEPVLKETDAIPSESAAEAIQARIDLRHLPLVTIDGADAKDFDDAVYCEPKPKGWRLLVAIADVSHYVAPDTALDQEAAQRGNSVYFPERVIPMLPEVLSNGLCSLNPGQDRFCLTGELYVNREGRVTRSQFFAGVMRSHARLTYDEVAGILVEKDRALRQKRGPLVSHLENLYRVYQALATERRGRGAMDFDTLESRVIFGEGRKIEKIVPLVRNDAHRLIEECMIAANIAAARYLARKKMIVLRRVHEGPQADKLEDLRQFLGELGLTLPGGKRPEPRDFMSVLASVKGRADAHLIQTVLLRSLAQAFYSPQPAGHFGLALEAYTHFTSPIRRYPDLLVHRAIRHSLEGKRPEEFRYAPSEMAKLGEHCSATERRADEATRDVVTWLKCEFMLDKLGETFSGVISAVTAFGFFVELRDVFVEGLVHISSLGTDYFHYDPVHHRLQGERTGVRYRLGDSVEVIVARVDLDERKIDFNLAASERMSAARRRGARRRRR